MRQLKTDTIFITEKIELSMGCTQTGMPMQALQAKHYHQEMKVFEVSKIALLASNENKTLTLALIKIAQQRKLKYLPYSANKFYPRCSTYIPNG